MHARRLLAFHGKIHVNILRHKKRQIIHYSLFIILFSLILNLCGFAQVVPGSHCIYFISDVQAPMKAERIISKYYRNEEARDSLFADMIRQRPENLFMLGDLSRKGSNEGAWGPLDGLMKALGKTKTRIYAIPGNHEYFGELPDMKTFKHRFPGQWLYGYLVNIDSIAIVMLNSNFSEISIKEFTRQQAWYESVMDSLDVNPAVLAVIVCTHHPPYSNSKVVGSDEQVQELIVPRFKSSIKSKLFISGHSHNLEYFNTLEKHFLVIGGGGGIAQSLYPVDRQKPKDLLSQNAKPLYFYLVIEKTGNSLKLVARGFKWDFRFFEFDFGSVTLN
ncbi:MAG: metallophosphoesterase [Bacteroidetes bacterium]|nr:metallophosphoesterase [Bacteroidota bacterium]